MDVRSTTGATVCILIITFVISRLLKCQRMEMIPFPRLTDICCSSIWGDILQRFAYRFSLLCFRKKRFWRKDSSSLVDNHKSLHLFAFSCLKYLYLSTRCIHCKVINRFCVCPLLLVWKKKSCSCDCCPFHLQSLG